MPKTIEAEVIEIDGVVPPRNSRNEEESTSASSKARAGIRGALLKLDRRWWPLWVLLGVALVILIATVGAVAGVCYLVYSLIRGIFNSIFVGPSAGGADSGSLRQG